MVHATTSLIKETNKRDIGKMEDVTLLPLRIWELTPEAPFLHQSMNVDRHSE
jgi:hypothetical protein